MRKASFPTVTLVLVAGVALAGPPASAGEPDAETRSEVPALADLHEAIFPLWHEAWPSKDYEKMKALLPQLRAGVAKVAEARLPGILRDKQGLLR